MQQKVAVTLCLVLLILAQQVSAGPLPSQDQDQIQEQSAGSPGDHTVRALRRIARMTPLWRTMNSKPPGAYCQKNYECSTGLCSEGHCHRASESVKY